uniref:Prokaryotic-type class I peptide chain release factors domain-containing protein n=1 Tax=Cannabis sativa TaxID=3483 RepID=A0A803R4R9_CANSA
MAVLRTTTTNVILNRLLQPSLSLSLLLSDSSKLTATINALPHRPAVQRGISLARVRCAASGSDGGGKVSSRLSHVQQLLQEAEERALEADDGPTPNITLDHVTVSFARSGGPGGQNVNKGLLKDYFRSVFFMFISHLILMPNSSFFFSLTVNTKVDMRFNVKNAHWLSERIRDRIMQMVFHCSLVYMFSFQLTMFGWGHFSFSVFRQ